MEPTTQNGALRQKVLGKIVNVSHRFHFEPLTSEISERVLLPKNITLMALSHLLNNNHLVVGDPGWGKSTAAKIIASVFTGIPYDLLESLEMRGSAGQLEEKMVARLHFGELNAKGLERVLWLGTLGVPVLNIDEISHLTEDMQKAILQGMATGIWNYGGQSGNFGIKPTVATTNFLPDGSLAIVHALKDRFHIVTDEGYRGIESSISSYDYLQAEENVEQYLKDRKITGEALKLLSQTNDEKYMEKFMQHVSQNRLSKVEWLADGERAKILEEINAIPLVSETVDGKVGRKAINDTALFLMSFRHGINWSEQFGAKRSTDLISQNAHDKNYLGVHLKTALSPRWEAAVLYIKGLAWLAGQAYADINLAAFLLPHAIAHKVAFDDAFVNSNAKEKRNDVRQIHLAKKLVEIAQEQYEKAAGGLKNVLAEIMKHSEAGNDEEILRMKAGEQDHPAAKAMILTAQNEALKRKHYPGIIDNEGKV